MTACQHDLYEMYVSNCKRVFRNQDMEQTNKSGKLLEVICSLRKIVNHPYIFFQYHEKVNSESGKISRMEEDSSIRKMNFKEYHEYMFYQD